MSIMKGLQKHNAEKSGKFGVFIKIFYVIFGKF